MAKMIERNTGDVIPASDHNTVKDYVEDATEDINTKSLSIGGVSVIDSSRNITGNNLSGTNTGDQDSSDFDIKDLTDSTSLRNTWSGKQDALGFTPENAANKGQNNGYAELDAGGKVPNTQLPSTLLVYKGVWNADTNTPTLTATDTDKKGFVYNVSVAGTQFGIAFKLGDWAIYNDSGVLEKSDNSDDVVSVNGQQGTVVLNASHVGAEVPLTFSTGLTRNTNTITVNNSQVNHDALQNYVANEHIDWTNTTSNFKTTGTAEVATTYKFGTAAQIVYNSLTESIDFTFN